MLSQLPHPHKSDSHVQRDCEETIREKLREEFGIPSWQTPHEHWGAKPDGYFTNGDTCIVVEIYARVRKAKVAGINKLMKDAFKQLYIEKLVQSPCKKLLAIVSDEVESQIGEKSPHWYSKALKEYGIEVITVPLSEEQLKLILIN